MFDFIKRWLNPPKPQAIQETRAVTYEQGLASGLILEPTAAGIALTNEKPLTVSAFYAAVRHIAEAIASLPIKIMVKQDDGGKLADPEHPLHQLLAHEPNSYQTSAGFREWFMTQILLYGNAYAKIERANSGQVLSLISLPATYVLVAWDLANKRLSYTVEASPYTESEVLPSDDILHVSGLSLDGLTGVNPLELWRESMGLTIALERFGASFFGHGARPSGVLKTTGMLSDKAKINLKESWQRAYTGSGKTGSVPVLEEGLEFLPFNIQNNEAQYVESKQHAIRECSRWAKISPTKLGDLSRATWANIESENLSFITTTLAPWLHKLEQEMNRKLLMPSERQTHTIEFDVSGLLRGDSKTRYANYQSALAAGWMTVEEIRVMEGLPPEPTLGVLRTPLNYGPNDGQDDGQDEQPQEEQFNTEQDKDSD